MKLVLFDIDGTLIDRIGSVHSRHRFIRSLNDVYGVEIPLDTSIDLNGLIDRQIAWTLLKPYGISKKEFDSRFQEYSRALLHSTQHIVRNEDLHYIPIPEAVELAAMLKRKTGVRIGLLTGNTAAVAWWKLDHVGIRDLFSFGLFGDDMEDRISLAKTVFSRARAHFHQAFLPEDIVVIGDTVFDVRCGKAIGAKTIAVTTGGHLVTKVNPKAGTYENALRMEHPDLLVSSLTDKPVLDFFGLDGVQQKNT